MFRIKRKIGVCLVLSSMLFVACSSKPQRVTQTREELAVNKIECKDLLEDYTYELDKDSNVIFVKRDIYSDVKGKLSAGVRVEDIQKYESEKSEKLKNIDGLEYKSTFNQNLGVVLNETSIDYTKADMKQLYDRDLKGFSNIEQADQKD